MFLVFASPILLAAVRLASDNVTVNDNLDPSIGLIIAAAVTTLGVLGAAVVTAVYARKSSRNAKKSAEAIGEPNGQGTVVKMLEDLLMAHGDLKGDLADVKSDVADVKEETRKNRAEIEVARGMVEELGVQFHDHAADDTRNFDAVREAVASLPQLAAQQTVDAEPSEETVEVPAQ